MAWLLAHPAGILPVMGTKALDRFARLSQALAVGLSREDWFELYTATEGREVPGTPGWWTVSDSTEAASNRFIPQPWHDRADRAPRETCAAVVLRDEP